MLEKITYYNYNDIDNTPKIKEKVKKYFLGGKTSIKVLDIIDCNFSKIANKYIKEYKTETKELETELQERVYNVLYNNLSELIKRGEYDTQTILQELKKGTFYKCLLELNFKDNKETRQSYNKNVNILCKDLNLIKNPYTPPKQKKISLGWKLYAISKSINKILK